MYYVTTFHKPRAKRIIFKTKNRSGILGKISASLPLIMIILFFGDDGESYPIYGVGKLRLQLNRWSEQEYELAPWKK